MKITFAKRLILAFLFVGNYFPAIAQLGFEPPEIEDPEAKFYPLIVPDGEHLNGPVKSLTYTESAMKSRTLFDKSRRETIRYDYWGTKTGRTETSYSGKYKREERHFENDTLIRKLMIFQDSTGKNNEWIDIHFGWDDNTNRNEQDTGLHWLYVWNKYGKLSASYAVEGDTYRELKTALFYDDKGILVRSESGPLMTVYTYTNGRVVNKAVLAKEDSSLDHSYNYFYYENGLFKRWSSDSYSEQYEYTDGKLTRSLAIGVNKADSISKDSRFQYHDNLLVSIIIKMKYRYDHFVLGRPIFTERQTESWIEGKLNDVVINFIYDKHKNITEIRYNLNGEYKFSRRYLYEYY